MNKTFWELYILRVYGTPYQEKEFKYIKHSLKSLRYPKFFLLNMRKKSSSNKLQKNTPTIPITHRPISQPNNTHNKPLNHKLTKLGIPVIQTIKNLTNILKRNNNATTGHTGIYSIPCKDCNKHDIGKTQCNLEKRIYEYK